MKWLKGDALLVTASGLSMGILGAALAFWGNPANSGICISCFVENLSGALRMHENARMSYLRPELVGFISGAFVMALVGREHRSRSGMMPFVGFLMGVILVTGSSVFMGCPIKMMLRLGAGDLTAAAGIAGLALGVWVGILYLRSGLDLGSPEPGSGGFQGMLLPLLAVALFLSSLVFPDLLVFSSTGPGAQYAPVLVSLSAGLLIGALAQRSRFCVTGSFANLYLARDSDLMKGLAALLASAVVINISLGLFRIGMFDQPGSNPDHLWNFLSMAMVGFASVLAGGCPFRQLVLAGEGVVDSAVIVLGMIAGGGIVHQWGIASTAAGPTPAGKVSVLAGLIFCLLIARFYRVKV